MGAFAIAGVLLVFLVVMSALASSVFLLTRPPPAPPPVFTLTVRDTGPVAPGTERPDQVRIDCDGVSKVRDARNAPNCRGREVRHNAELVGKGGAVDGLAWELQGLSYPVRDVGALGTADVCSIVVRQRSGVPFPTEPNKAHTFSLRCRA